jgi:hypothetical protein
MALELGMASRMASELELVIEPEMVLGIITEMVSGLEKASGMLLEITLFDWACLVGGDLGCVIGSSSLLFTVLFEPDVIAVLEEC